MIKFSIIEWTLICYKVHRAHYIGIEEIKILHRGFHLNQREREHLLRREFKAKL